MSGFDVVYTRTGHVTLRNIEQGAAQSAAGRFGQGYAPRTYLVVPTGTYVHPSAEEARDAYKRGATREPFAAPADDASAAEWHGYHEATRMRYSNT